MKPTPFGPYTLLRQIATSETAEVFEAKRTDRRGKFSTLALKRILPQFSGDPQISELFQREAQEAASLNHPNIVQIVDHGTIDDRLYVAMEYVSGLSLGELIRKQRQGRLQMPVAVALYIASEVLKALAVAHRHASSDEHICPIIHRFITPNNVLITLDGRIKVTDFGIAKTFHGYSNLDPSLASSETILHVAPELLLGEPADETSDLYSVGVLLFILLTGKAPFEGDNWDATMKKVLQGVYTPARQLDPSISVSLSQIVDKSLRRNPDQRFQAAPEFSSALQRELFSERGTDLRKKMSEYLSSLLDERTAVGEILSPPKGPETTVFETEPEVDVSVVTQKRGPSKGSWKKFFWIFPAVLIPTIILWTLNRTHPPQIVDVPIATPTVTETDQPELEPTPTETPAFVPTPRPTVKPFKPAPKRTPPPKPKLKPKPAPKIVSPVASALGFLTIVPDGPFANVTVDGKLLGNTPILRQPLPVGRHKVVFENEKLGQKREVEITVVGNQETKLTDIWNQEPPASNSAP